MKLFTQEEKFKYPKVIYENTTEISRVYSFEHNGALYEGLYSVTTILSKTSDKKEIIQEWREKVGHVRADEITERSIKIGNMMHEHLELYLKNTSMEGNKNYLYLFSLKMANNIKFYLDTFLDELWGNEVALFVPNMYAGRTDCVGIYRGKQSIVDFKNSRVVRDESFFVDYQLQLAAYAIAHDYLFGTNIEQGVILIADQETQEAREFVYNGEQFKEFKYLWMDKVELFING